MAGDFHGDLLRSLIALPSYRLTYFIAVLVADAALPGGAHPASRLAVSDLTELLIQ